MTTLRSIDDLEAAALLEDGATPELEAVAARYAVAITPTVSELIRQGAPGIAAQFLPDARELVTMPAENPDPIGDHSHSPV
ncbi:MAG: lysine 2,3-aminomutase, partial [Methylobacterium sp.]|nr:lysine 2,3-aminomutase [Methylobacterium sp.]